MHRFSMVTYSNFSSFKERLNSFIEWPIQMKQMAEMMSRAGFFYTGSSDRTICFMCGGGVKNWYCTDDPWVVHAFYYDKCDFVRLMKGNDYIKRVHREISMENCNVNNRHYFRSIPIRHNQPSTSASTNHHYPPVVNGDPLLCKLCFENKINPIEFFYRNC